MFTEFGWPDYIRTDKGPQWPRGGIQHFCSKHNIKQLETLLLILPRIKRFGRGMQLTVNNLKSLTSRCSRAGENMNLAMEAWGNIARTVPYERYLHELMLKLVGDKAELFQAFGAREQLHKERTLETAAVVDKSDWD